MIEVIILYLLYDAYLFLTHRKVTLVKIVFSNFILNIRIKMLNSFFFSIPEHSRQGIKGTDIPKVFPLLFKDENIVLY